MKLFIDFKGGYLIIPIFPTSAILAVGFAFALAGCASREDAFVALQFGDLEDHFAFLPLDAPFAGKVLPFGSARVTGWIEQAGELVLYPSRAAMRAVQFEKVSPRETGCLSVVFDDQYERNFSNFIGKRVTVIGDIYAFSALPKSGPNEFSDFRPIGKTAIINWCYREQVMLARAIIPTP